MIACNRGIFMKTVAVVSQKGGAGKTTMSVHVAAAAVQAGENVVIIDLDPQTNAASWGDLRDAEEPAVLAVPPGRLSHAMQAAREEGVTLAVIDTAAKSENPALEAAKTANVVLIPCRRSFFDVDAMSWTVNLLKLAGKPGYVVLNALKPGSTKIQGDVMKAMGAYGLTVAPVVMHDRAAYINAIPAGQVAQEFEPGGAAAQEIKDLYAWLQRTINA
jgi:chromosome partitioning protein